MSFRRGKTERQKWLKRKQSKREVWRIQITGKERLSSEEQRGKEVRVFFSADPEVQLAGQIKRVTALMSDLMCEKHLTAVWDGDTHTHTDILTYDETLSLLNLTAHGTSLAMS